MWPYTVGKQPWISSPANSRAVVRYADDFCVFCETQQDAESAHQILAEWLWQRGLEFSPEKTRLVHLSEGIDCLGTSIKRYATAKRKSGKVVLLHPSKKAVSKFRNKLCEQWLNLNGTNVQAVIDTLNPSIRGWANYHRKQAARRTFKKPDHWMFGRQVRYTRRAHPIKPRYWLECKYWGRLNLDRKDT